MNTPNEFTAQEIKAWNMDQQDGDFWIPARPLGLQGLFLMRRLRLAWDVFLGRKDVLNWSFKIPAGATSVRMEFSENFVGSVNGLAMDGGFVKHATDTARPGNTLPEFNVLIQNGKAKISAA